MRDTTTGELTAEFNRGTPRGERVHVSSVKTVLHRHGYMVKDATRPLERLRGGAMASSVTMDRVPPASALGSTPSVRR